MILDQSGHPATGKFGASDEYLKFTFDNHELCITESPFDPAIPWFHITFYNNFIDLIKGKGVIDIPEEIYFIISITKNNFILCTLNPESDTIFYYYTNQNVYTQKFHPSANIIDFGLIIVKTSEIRGTK